MGGGGPGDYFGQTTEGLAWLRQSAGLARAGTVAEIKHILLGFMWCPLVFVFVWWLDCFTKSSSYYFRSAKHISRCVVGLVVV